MGLIQKRISSHHTLAVNCCNTFWAAIFKVWTCRDRFSLLHEVLSGKRTWKMKGIYNLLYMTRILPIRMSLKTMTPRTMNTKPRISRPWNVCQLTAKEIAHTRMDLLLLMMTTWTAERLFMILSPYKTQITSRIVEPKNIKKFEMMGKGIEKRSRKSKKGKKWK